MPESKKWVCEAFPHEHIFDRPTDDGFCPMDPPYHGRLRPENLPVQPPGGAISIESPKDQSVFSEGETIRLQASATGDMGNITRVDFLINGRKAGEGSSHPYQCSYTASREGAYDVTAVAWFRNGSNMSSGTLRFNVKKGSVRELGLCVLLMDASSSMTEPAAEGESVTRLQQVAESAATGIFELQRLRNNQDAWITAFKFDDRVEKMFEDSVDSLIRRFDKDVSKFTTFIYEELYKMQQGTQGTDINAALKKAYAYVEGFLKKKLDFPVKNYTPMYQSVLLGNSARSVSIPNIRVLLYTDGMQYDSSGNRRLKPNPFSASPLAGLNHDIVIGAFLGRSSEEGCNELKELLGNCPIHDEVQQFFLLDTAKKLGLMKHLFRMASGASGFCPLCLGKQLSW